METLSYSSDKIDIHITKKYNKKNNNKKNMKEKITIWKQTNKI